MKPLESSIAQPPFVTLEAPAKNLDGLTATPELKQLGDIVLRQWSQTRKLEQLAKYGIQPLRQILFYGPPGNGKTTACQWLGRKMEMRVYRVMSEAVVAGILGGTQRNVGALMSWLRSLGPSIVLFDEIESLFPSRESGSDNCSRELQAAMTVLWQSLDRWTTPQLFVFATNMPERLDRAFLSRFEMQIEFGPPTQEQIEKVVAYWREIFHEYDSDSWAPGLAQHPFTSFRALWQTISDCVRDAALSETQ